jgi:hypothetical protein
LGTLLRVLAILVLPYAFFANGDPLFSLAWWWLLLGVDWPDLPASSSVFVELLAIVVCAQALHKSEFHIRFCAFSLSTVFLCFRQFQRHVARTSRVAWRSNVASRACALRHLFGARHFSCAFHTLHRLVDGASFFVLSLLFCVFEFACLDGCAFDLNRVLSGWGSPFLDDLENQKGE